MTVPTQRVGRGSRGIPRVYTFTVIGDDLFPFDMLRYDRCTPKSESDSAAIRRTTNPRMVASHGSHRVTLVGPKAPTEPRWGSFGWAVESVE